MRKSLCLMVLGAWLCAAAAPEVVTLSNGNLSLTLNNGAPTSLTDVATGTVLAAWPNGNAGWYYQTMGNYTRQSPGLPVSTQLEDPGDGGASALLSYHRTTSPQADATVRLVLEAGAPYVSMQLTLTNRSNVEFDVVGMPGDVRVTKGAQRFIVHPFESGILIPLDDRFARIRMYNQYPMVFGYPESQATMQWLGVQGPDAGFMLMNEDRYGMLKRLGAEDAGTMARLVFDHQVSLKPGESVELPPMRLYAFPGGDYRAMAGSYRSWVRERTSTDGVLARDVVDGVQKMPLQFVPLAAKRVQRPHIDGLRNTTGYPEHALRDSPTQGIFPYAPYGLEVEMVRGFEAVYGTKVVPQLWSFSKDWLEGGWPLFPVDPKAEMAIADYGVLFPAMTFGAFLRELRASDDIVFLYTNPTFIRDNSPDYVAGEMFHTTPTSGPHSVGFDPHSFYVSPWLVQDFQVAQLSPLAAYQGDLEARALGIMFDSSSSVGGYLYHTSVWRRDSVSDIDRNPAAQYIERYGYTGRDSYVQDRIQRDAALHEATPDACKVGEWINELTTMHLDMNAGSIDLTREYPDTSARPPDENVIPVPLYQMVYGDAQYFVIRVGAASDANLPNQGSPTTAEASRRATSIFGAVHQSLYWGHVRWAGRGYLRLYGRTYLITRDNVARENILGRAADFRMLDPSGTPDVDLFAVRETAWRDDEGHTLGMHWDNNTGANADLNLDTEFGTVRIDTLWGENRYLAGSLDRLRAGATVTLLRDGRFALWDFAGNAAWFDEFDVEVSDQADTSEGLTVIWDGERLSLGNATTSPREVTLTCSLNGLTQLKPLPQATLHAPNGAVSTVRYMDALEYSGSVQSGVCYLHVNLPAADAPVSYEIPTKIVSFVASLLGDLDGSRTVDAVDVQLVINAALALNPGIEGDVDLSGRVSATDVQLVINAALDIAMTVPIPALS